MKVDVAIIGSGTAGLNAMGRVKRAGRSFVLINGGEPGTTCARVGCMPSKALIQVAEDMHRRHLFDRMGILGGEKISVDRPAVLEYVRDLRDHFVDRVLSNSTDHLSEEQFIEQYARFVADNVLELEDGRQIEAKSIVIATGSRPIIPPDWQLLGDRIITTDQLFELADLPDRLAVIGLGVIGLELGQAIARLGVEVTGVESSQYIGGIRDPEVNQAAIELFSKELTLWTGQKAEIEPDGKQLLIRAGDKTVQVDQALVCIGRRPNLERLNLDVLGIKLNEQGLPKYDPQTMQIEDRPIFLAGDINADRPILHEAGDEGKIAGYNAAHFDQIWSFQRKKSLRIIFSDPNIVQIGQSYDELDLERTAIGTMKIAPVGRALIMGKNRGVIRVYADKKSGILLGAEMIAPRGENLAHLLNWCLEQNLTVGQLMQMPYYHPVMEEALQAAIVSLYHQVDEVNPGPIAELKPI